MHYTELKDHFAIEDYCTVWCCQGPPRCDLDEDASMVTQQNGCPFCKQIRVSDDGTEAVIEPGNA